jgi:UDP-N-acetylglucosamine--N-acetylmuramyl-(pentapeptide) pyrophosphoryl-undecaprenol N-acetylglucosamine transferase
MSLIVPLEELKYKRGAIVVTTGGHLEQALRRMKQFDLGEAVTFFVPRNSQSESRLSEYKKHFIGNVRSRDLFGLIRVFVQLLSLLKKRDFDYVLSTGAGVAIACRVVCKVKGIDFIYIESIARQLAPSMTGRILAKMRTRNLYTESKNFDPQKWLTVKSLFSEYKQFSRVIGEIEPKTFNIFVTVGTVHQYEFKRLVNLVNSVLTKADNVVWQIGPLNGQGLQGKVFKELTSKEFAKNLSQADVVVSHAGVGSVLNVLDSGHFPILIPRRVEFGEHVDNHQMEIASVVYGLSLCTVITDALSRSDLLQAHVKGISISKQC